MSLDLRIDGLRIDNSGNIINSFDCKAIGRDSYIGFRSNNSLGQILMEKKELSDLSHLEEQIDESIKGLKNIRKCYKEDPAVCSHVDAIMLDFAETIGRKIQRFLVANDYGDFEGSEQESESFSAQDK